MAERDLRVDWLKQQLDWFDESGDRYDERWGERDDQEARRYWGCLRRGAYKYSRDVWREVMRHEPDCVAGLSCQMDMALGLIDDQQTQEDYILVFHRVACYLRGVVEEQEERKKDAF